MRSITMDAIATLGPEYAIPEEERAVPSQRETYGQLLRRLSRQSVVKHFDAYADVPWDDPAYAIDPDDPRWELGADDGLGGTAWYRSQPAAVRSRLALHMYATFMKIGAQFENVLQRGLLEFALRLPNGSPEFRYAYHECIEEGQHSLMFQEFVNRAGFDIPGLGWWERIGSRRVIGHARRFPELFFVFVLGGEDPIDHVQRTVLRSGRDIPPILKRIMQIHVTEEARHLCFARQYLRARVPSLPAPKRAALALGAPLILGQMAKLMMQPSAQITRTYGIPDAVIDEAYTKNPEHRRKTVVALTKVRELCRELDLVTPWSRRVWELGGIWAS
jgi:para-aminobenzoate N-oxygenase AurF